MLLITQNGNSSLPNNLPVKFKIINFFLPIISYKQTNNRFSIKNLSSSVTIINKNSKLNLKFFLITNFVSNLNQDSNYTKSETYPLGFLHILNSK